MDDLVVAVIVAVERCLQVACPHWHNAFVARQRAIQLRQTLTFDGQSFRMKREGWSRSGDASSWSTFKRRFSVCAIASSRGATARRLACATSSRESLISSSQLSMGLPGGVQVCRGIIVLFPFFSSFLIFPVSGTDPSCLGHAALPAIVLG